MKQRLLPLIFLSLAGSLLAEPTGHDFSRGRATQSELHSPNEQEHTPRFQPGPPPPTAKKVAFNERDLEAAESQIDYCLQKAAVAMRMHEPESAEKFYVRALGYKMPDDVRKDIMMKLIHLHLDSKAFSKIATLYEKYLELFPKDPEAPQIYLTLGRLYREMGAIDTALNRFYKVINNSLSIPPEQIGRYQKLSREAQQEIAETFFQEGRYEDALNFYNRLKVLNLSDEEKEKVTFKLIYCRYHLGQFSGIVQELHQFMDDFPESDLIPEAYFLLAHTYKQLNKPQKAIEHVRKLLEYEKQSAGENGMLWQYWQRTTANQIANEFYEQNDFMNALKVYQSMAPLSGSPHWQWPIIYQIGLCFERLGMYPKAKEAYALIKDETAWSKENFTKNDNLSSIQEMAAWRLEHLNWLSDSDGRLQKLLGTPASTTPES